MHIPVRISLRGVRRSEALRHRIRHRAGKLDRYCGQIVDCSVALTSAAANGHHGQQVAVRIGIKVPEGEVVAVRKHGDARIAVRDAFDAAQRKLKGYARASSAGWRHSATA